MTGHLNINYFKNKFTDFIEVILNETKVLYVKGNQTFQNCQFFKLKNIDQDRNKLPGGVILFVEENVPGKIINGHRFPASFEIKINWNRKMLE